MFIRFPNGLKKALTLSYDDGVEQDRELIRILDEYGIRATFNLNSGCFAPEGTVYAPGTIHRRMSKSAVQALYGQGNHEVSAHCLTHASLTELTPDQIAQEALQDRANLEEMFGVLVRGMAYPFGTYNDKAVEVLGNCGVAYCRTVNSTHRFEIPSDWLRLHPTCHHNDPQLMNLCDRFLTDTVPFGSELFYLWGHAYEFEANDNWQLIIDFCKKMAGHEDIWYATNIDIVNYINAARRLVFSVNNTRVWNPTSTDVWVELNGKLLKVPAGATIRC